jgi:hypothetical protein
MDEDLHMLDGRNALYVTNIKTLKESDVGEEFGEVKRYFSDVKLIRTQVLLNRFGKVSRLVKYYYCTGYQAASGEGGGSVVAPGH